MSGRALEARADAPLSELQQLLAESAEGRIAIVDEEAVAGVVTRRDVLRALDEAAEPQTRRESRSQPSCSGAPSARAGLRRDLRRRAKAWKASIWSAAPCGTSCSASRASTSTSPSRAMRSRSPGGSRASSAAGRASTRSSAPPSSLYGDGERVDVVTARTEFYDAPAALPAVEHASIREDLYRRDFTVNAMAASLKGEDFGRLVDPFGGQRRPRRGHRARPAQPLVHRRPDAHLPGHPLREPVRLPHGRAHGAAGPLVRRDGARWRPLVGAAARRADRTARGGRGRALAASARRARRRERHPSASRRRRRGRRGSSTAARQLARELDVDVPDWRLGLAVLARRMSAARRSPTGSTGSRCAGGTPTSSPRQWWSGRGSSAVCARRALPPSEIVTMAEQYAPDAPLFALALQELQPLRRYFEELRHVRLDVAGAELAELGSGESPRVGEILAELRRRKLDGELDGRDAELAAARELIEADGVTRARAPCAGTRRALTRSCSRPGRAASATEPMHRSTSAS